MCVCSRPRMIHDNDPTDLHIPQIYGLLKWIYFSASSYPSACSTHMGKSLRWCQIMMVWRIVKIEKGLKAKFRVTSDFISRSNFQTDTLKLIIWIRVSCSDDQNWLPLVLQCPRDPYLLCECRGGGDLLKSCHMIASEIMKVEKGYNG